MSSLLALTLAAAVLAAVAWSLYRYEREDAWRRAGEELEIVARTKVAQLETWRQERQNDAAFLSRAGFVAKDVAALLAQPESGAARAEVLGWLGSMKAGERYAEAIVFDREGRALLSLPEQASGAASPRLRQLLREALAQPAVRFHEPGRDAQGRPDYFEVVAPIFPPREEASAGAAADAAPGAFVVLRIRPQSFAVPLLGAWPTTRRSAEALLVFPAGPEFVFLTDPRLGAAEAAPLPRARNEPDLAAARALRGERGVMHARDYRGERVLAVFRPVQGMDCLLGVKIDEAEIAATLAPRLQSLLATLAALGLAVAGGIGWFWRGREMEMLRRELASEAARLEAEARFRLLASTIDEVVWVADVAPLRFVYVSPAAARVWGCTAEALLARAETWLETVHPEDRAAAAAKLRLMRGGAAFELTHRVASAGGAVRWARLRAFPIQPADGGPITQYAGAAEDITARQQALEQLRVREERLAFLARATSDVVWDFDVRTGDIWWGDTADNVFGCTRAELGTSVAEWSGRLHPEDFPRVRRKLQEALAGTADNWTDEYRFRRHDGTYADIVDRGTIVRDEAGRAVRAVGGMSDVTARRRLEAELAQRERQLDAFFTNATAGLVVLDRALRYVKINDTFASMHGLPTAEHLGRRVEDILPDLAPTVLPLLRRVVEEGESFHNVEVSGTTPRQLGVVRHWLESYFPVLDASGAPEFVGAVVIEISALRRATEAMRESEQRFRQLAENIAEVFWIASPALDELLYVSPAYARIWGRSVERLLAQPREWLEHIHPEDRARIAQAREHMALGKFDEVYRVVRPDGVVRWVRDRAFPIRDAAGAVYRLVGVAEDITERRELEDQFQQAQKMEALGTLAGGIAHDFNNILASINGYTALAKINAARGSDPGEYLEEVLRASARAADLVRQILAFSRRQEHERVPLQLGTIVGESVRLLRATLPTTIDFEVALPKQLAPVLADPTQVHQIVMNLGTNAWHAMRDRKGVLGVRLAEVEIGATAGPAAKLKPGKYLQLEVSDTGHGMTAAVRERIFEPFFTTKPPGEGTGLGLSVVHGIVRAHDGDIAVESEPGKGTRFRVWFPAVAGSSAPAAPRKAAVPRGQGERVLLVDDEEAIVRMQRLALEHFGYTVEAHERPEDALAAFRARAAEFAVVVTDFTMPGLTGLELAAEMGRLRPGVPVVLTSGYTAALSDERLREAGVALLIPKPTTVDALCTAVHRVLHGPKKA